MEGIALANIVRAAKSLGKKLAYVTCKLPDIPPQAALYLSNVMLWFRPVTQVAERHFERNLAFETALTTELSRESYKTGSVSPTG